MTCFEPGEGAAAACGFFLVSRLFMVMVLGDCMAYGVLSRLDRQAGQPKSSGLPLAGGCVLGVRLQGFQFAAIGLGRRFGSGVTIS